MMNSSVALLLLIVGCTFSSPTKSSESKSQEEYSDEGVQIDKDKLVKLVASVKEQQLRILGLEGKINISQEALDAVKNSNETTIGDVEYSPQQVEHIKAELDEREKFLKRTGGRGRATSPDFERLPHMRWDMPIKYTTDKIRTAKGRQVIDDSLKDLAQKSDGCLVFEKVQGTPSGPHLSFEEELSKENLAAVHPWANNPRKTQ